MGKRILLGSVLLAVLLLAGCAGGLSGQGEPEEVKLESMAAYPQTLALKNGGEAVVQVVFTPSDAEDTGLLWVSSNKSVANVNNSGVVTAVSEGSCTITVASAEYSNIFCDIAVTVGSGETAAQPTQTETPQPSGGKQVIVLDPGTDIVYVQETNASRVYPSYALSAAEVASMSGEELQFTINQIYAKNGYIFRTDSIQSYFSRMPWYVPVSNNTANLGLSALDQSNLNLLVRYRESSGSTASGLGWLWTKYAVERSLTQSELAHYSDYDIQLLINTIYAKNGYIFQTDSLQALFEGQSWYRGITSDGSRLSFSAMDQANLRLLIANR